MSNSLPQTDVSRPAALARATLQTSSRSQQQALIEQSSEEYLDSIEEEWNRRLDSEVEVLVEGMGDLVAIASVGICLQTLTLIVYTRTRLAIRTSFVSHRNRSKHNVAPSLWQVTSASAQVIY